MEHITRGQVFNAGYEAAKADKPKAPAMNATYREAIKDLPVGHPWTKLYAESFTNGYDEYVDMLVAQL